LIDFASHCIHKRRVDNPRLSSTVSVSRS
jgi:hypothetical protein